MVPTTKFALFVDGRMIASFSQLQRLAGQAGAVDFMSSGRGETLLLLPAVRSGPQSIALARPHGSSPELWQWHQAATFGRMDAARRSCSLVMYDAEDKPVARLYLTKAWPSKIDISPPAGWGSVAVETVTLTCEDIQRISP